MSEKLKTYLEKLKTALKKVSKKIWIVAAVVVVAIAAIIAIYWNTRPYTTLFTELSSNDVSKILSYFDEWGIRDYRIEGTTISVPSSQETAIRSKILMEGYPNQGYSYSYDDYYNHVSALSTNAERQQAWLISVQERMGAVIATFDGVREATVTYTLGEDLTYVLDSSRATKATASVILTMSEGRTLSEGQAGVIRNFVASGVQGLEVASVTIGDTVGNHYDDFSGSSALGYDAEATALKLQLEQEYSNRIRTQIMQVLSPGVGGDENVRVAVNCVVDVSTSEIDDYEVHLPEYAHDGSTYGAGIIGTIVWQGSFQLNGDEAVGGVPGTTSNADIPTVVENLTGNGENVDSFDISGETEMDNSKTQTHTVRTAAYIADCTVAISINSTAVPGGAVDIETVRSHAASAAGINAIETETQTAQEYLAAKISVWATPWPTDDVSTEPINTSFFNLPVDDWIVFAALAGILLFVVLLVVIILLSRKRKKKKQQQAEAEQQAVEQLLVAAGITEAEPVGADVMTLQTERSMELRQDIRKFAEENPEIAAQLVKSWLRGGDE